MKRKLSLLMAVIMILGSFSFAFAANDEVDVPEFLKEEGILVGGTDGDLMLEKNLTREEAVVLLSRLLKEEDAAKEFEVTEELPSFKDTKDIDPFWKPYIAWAEANEYFKGHTGEREGEFGFKDNLTARQYAVVLLRALGYVEEADNWDEAYETAVELGLLENIEAEKDEEIVREIAAQMTYNALGTNLKDSEETLADKLEIEMPVVTPDELEVVEVKADNLKEVVVTFNKEVDKATVTDANVSVVDKKGSATLLDDGHTVVITVKDSLNNQTSYTAVIKNVKAVDGAEMEEAKVEFKAFDATLPEVEDIVVTGPKSFELVFSEPMKKKGSLVIKQGNTKVGHKVEDPSGRKATVNVYTTLKDGEEYEVTVEKFEDFAGYVNVVNTVKFVYEKDATPPVAEVVKAEQTYVHVKFNKPVTGLKASQFYHTFNAWGAVGLYETAVFEGEDAKEITDKVSVTEAYVLFHELDEEGKATKDSRALPEGEVRFGITGKDIKDNWGNALGQFETTVKVSADKEAPEVAKVEVTGVNKITVTFTKDVVFDEKNVDVLDANEKKIDGLEWTVKASSGKKYEITLGKNMTGKDITLILKDVVDTALIPNKMDTYTEVINVIDKSELKVNNIYYSVAKDGKSGELTVIFNKEVDADAALSAKSYALVYENRGKVLPLSETPYFGLNSARVVIPLDKDEVKVVNDNADDIYLQIIGIEDLVGNKLAPTVKKISGAVTEISELEVTSIVATATNKIVVKLADLVSNVDEDFFEIIIADIADDGVEFGIEQSEDGGSTVLEFILGEDKDGDAYEFATDLSDLTFKYEPDKDDKDNYIGIVNSFGTVVTQLQVKKGENLVDVSENEFVYDAETKEHDITDKVAPERVSASYVVEDGKTVITIDYSEYIRGNALSTQVFAVKGGTVEKVEKAKTDGEEVDEKVVITVDKALTGDLTVTQLQPVFDKAGNSLKEDKAFTVKPTAKEKFLQDLKAEVAKIKVADVKIDDEDEGVDITVEFKANETVENIKTAAEELFAAIIKDVKAATLTLSKDEDDNDNETFNHDEEDVVRKVAEHLLSGVSAEDFLENGPVEASYTANITNKNDVEISLTGDVKFTVAKASEDN